MKLLFRRKADGYLMRPIQTLATCVRLSHVHSGLECLADTAHLRANFDVLTHDIERGDVLRDIRDGRLLIVERTNQHGLLLKSGILLKGMTYFGLIHFERVGRKYRLRDRPPRERATYDATQVQAKIKRATHEIINRFDAVTNAQRHAQEYGVGFIQVERDGSMKAIDPRSVILK